jgi:hypothetical protein
MTVISRGSVVVFAPNSEITQRRPLVKFSFFLSSRDSHANQTMFIKQFVPLQL